MAWNPSPEVAAARDAAKKLNDAEICVVAWVKDDQLGVASYGKTKAICEGEAKQLGETIYRAVTGDEGRLETLCAAVITSLAQMDQLADVWGDEAVFRRCRDRLRAALKETT